MGVLDSFKQDAFLSSQTQDCTTRVKKNKTKQHNKKPWHAEEWLETT